MYNGFLTKKLEYDYNTIVNRMTVLLIEQLSLQLQLNQIANKTSFTKQFYKLYNTIKELETQKAQPPKFSNLLQPLLFITNNEISSYQQQQQFIPPILEQDAAFSTQYTKTQSFSTRAKSQVVQGKVQQSPNKSSRISRYSDKKKPKIQLNISEFYAELQSDSVILGKKNQFNNSRFHTLEQNSMIRTPFNLEIQQQQQQLLQQTQD